MTIILITVEIDVLFIIYIFCAYIYITHLEKVFVILELP